MMPGSEFVRTGAGQWNKVPNNRLAESILHRSLSRELGLSLCAETVNNGNCAFFPPAVPVQRIIAPRPTTVPSHSIANNLTQATTSLLEGTEPEQDDHKLLSRARGFGVPMAAERTQGPTMPAVEVRTLPWTGNGEGPNVWAPGMTAEETRNAMFRAADQAVMAKSAMKFQKLMKYEKQLEEMKSIQQPPAPVVTNPEDELPQFCPVNNLPDQFKDMTVNQIFEVCMSRCLAAGEAEKAEATRKALENPEAGSEQDDDVDSIVSSDACTEDIPFMSSANIQSMKEREILRARRKEAAEKGAAQDSSSPTSTPEEDVTIDAGEQSFVSGNSDPEQSDTPLFTIRSKKQPIKIVDPKTLQRPDKPKSMNDLANDVEFLKRAMRVLGASSELTQQAYQLFKTIVMDMYILHQASEWCRYTHEFVEQYMKTLREEPHKLQSLKIRNEMFEQVGQVMGHKKKMDNSILGWMNFAISMFPVESASSPPRMLEGGGISLKEKSPPKVKHTHGDHCRNYNHDLQKLTEENRLKFKALHGRLVESLGDGKDWMVEAPSYAKGKPLRYTELKPFEGLPILVPLIEVEAPGAVGDRKFKHVTVVQKEKVSERVTVLENENTKKRTVTKEVETRDQHVEQSLPVEQQHYAYHAQQASWFQHGYLMHGFGPHGRASGSDYMHHGANLPHRPRSAINQQMSNDGYHHGQHHGSYHHDTMNKPTNRAQHNISRGRQGTRSGGQSRQPSTAGVRQLYAHPSSGHGGQTYTGYPGSSANDYLYNPEASSYQEVRFQYGNQGQQPGHHSQQPVLQHPQPYRSLSTNDSAYAESSHGHQYSQNTTTRATPEQILGSGEYLRHERVPTSAAAQQRSMSVAPPVMPHQHLGMHHHHHPGVDHFPGNGGSSHGMGFPISGHLYPGFVQASAAWHAHGFGGPSGHSTHGQGQSGRSGKNVGYQQYPQYR